MIENVELVKKIQLVDGEEIVLESPYFLVSDGLVTMQVPNNPQNRHYQEVKEWYEEQEKKPFDFDFE